MKKLLSLFALIGACLTLAAQDYKIVSVEELPLDMTAKEYIKTDENGRQCAVFRIATQNITPEQREGFYFQGDYGSYVVERSITAGEIWVWVSPGIKTLKIFHNKLGRWELHTANYGIMVKSLHTYKIVLRGTATGQLPENTVTKQFLLFDVTPKDVMVTVNSTPWVVTDGVAQKMVDFGTYEYRIEAQDYHPVEGRIEVDDPENKVVVKKTLVPAFGFLKIEGDKSLLSQASIYIDNANGSGALNTPQKLSSGQHKVRILHPLYKPYEQTVVICDNETNTLRVNLHSNFATITLNVDAEAEIWVNGEKKGVRSWTGDLETGSYILECRMKGHKTSRVEQSITSEMSGQILTLEVPQPLTGLLVLSSTPPMADIFIDGERMGETPMRINKITVGKHTLRLEKQGYKPFTSNFVIEDGKTLELEPKMELESSKKLKAESKPQKEKLAKDGIPNCWFATLNFAYSPSPQTSYGFCVGSVKKVGWFITAMSNFSFDALKYDYTTDADGCIYGAYPDYSGESCSTRISALGGVMLRVAEPLCLRAGLGYGMRVKSWYTTDNVLVKMDDDSCAGVEASMGAQLHWKHFVLNLDAVTNSFKTLEAKVGVGYCF